MIHKVHNLLLLLLMSSILLSSCHSPKYFAKINYSQIEENDCSGKMENIYLFKSVDTLDFNYKNMGIIGIIAGEEVPISEIETLIKMKAWENCANGVIEIPANNSLITSSNGNGKEIKKQNYSESFNYIAIKINLDSTFLSKYGNSIDTSFVSKGIEVEKKIFGTEPSGFVKVLIKIGKVLLSLALTSFLMWFQLWVMYNPHF